VGQWNLETIRHKTQEKKLQENTRGGMNFVKETNMCNGHKSIEKGKSSTSNVNIPPT
jgi:hypothetical protein